MSDWTKAEAESWDPNTEKEISGELLEVRDDVGKYKSTMATLRREDGSESAVWCNKMLAEKLRSRVGMEVKIVFTGEKQGKVFDKPYRTYDVFFREKPMTKAEEPTF